jgi:precorrin-6B methylase 2
MRLEAKIKSGFYPLPPEAVPHLASKLKVDPGATLFDPCAGKAQAAVKIAAALQIPLSKVYGAEMDEARFELVEAQLGANAFGPLDFLASSGSGSASIFYCNPPFDDEIGGGGRVEWRFLSRAHEYTQAGSILMAIIPQSTAEDWRTFEAMSPWFHTLRTSPLPIECRYNEQVVFGIRRKAQHAVDHSDRDDYRCDFEDLPVYTAAAGGPVTVRKRFYTPMEIQRLAKESLANELLSVKRTRAEREIVPPMRLTKGHTALLLASGFLDGIVQVSGEEPHVVRGSTRKVLTEKKSEEGGKIKLVKSEQIQLTVKVACSKGIVTLEDKLPDASTNNEQPEEQENDSTHSHE